MEIYARQEDVVPFYSNASVVVNLSDKNQFVETFGLTALEAMSAGLPVVVPTVGGIAEMVEDGKNGYKIDVQDLERIAACLERILSDKQAYCRMAENALSESKLYDAEAMVDAIAGCLEK